MIKSEYVERKFTNIININDYQVETDEGFVDIEAICETIPYTKYIIETNTHKILINIFYLMKNMKKCLLMN